ncbi:MAG: nucleoside deaminase [Methanobacteriota archaeon]
MPNDAKRRFMALAIDQSREGVREGQTPFGACIVKDGEVVSCAHNNVWASTDITAHAEIVAIRGACAKLGTIDLSGCDIYSTTEPCPMCFSAIHWARIGEVVFGASIADAKAYGFHELPISNEAMKETGKSPIKITRGFMAREALDVFAEWAKSKEKRTY